MAAYAGSFGGPFVFDDLPALAENSSLRHLASGFFPPADVTTSGRPLVNFSFAINYAVSGLEVWSYHLVNLLIHLGAGLALFGVVRRTLLLESMPAHVRSAANALGFAAAALWLLHPLQTESVTYLVQRAESLMGLCYLLTLYCFIRGAQSEAPRIWFALAFAACAAGMASKEVMVSAPLLVFLYDRTFLAGSFRSAWNRRKQLHLALAGTWLLLAVLVLGAGGNRSGSAGFGAGLAWRDYVPTQFRAIDHYLALAFWPRPLVFEYGTFRETDAVMVAAFGLPVVALGIGIGVALRRWPMIGFLGAWFGAMLAPTSLVPQPTQMIVEHRMYLSLAAVTTAVAVFAFLRFGQRGLRLLLIPAVGLGWATACRNQDYRSALSLWSDTVAKRPDNAVAHYNYGLLLEQNHAAQDALVQFDAALALRPDYAAAHLGIGNILLQSGQPAAAITHYQAALQRLPRDPRVLGNLGLALLRTGRLPESAAAYETALQVNPADSAAHNNLGMALAQLGRLPDAVQHFTEALRLNPNYAAAHNNLGNVLQQLGQMPEAEAHFESALRLRPDLESARQSLVKLRAARGR